MKRNLGKIWMTSAAVCALMAWSGSASAAAFGVQGGVDLANPACGSQGLCSLPSAVAAARTSFVGLLATGYRTEEFSSPTQPLNGLFGGNATIFSPGGTLDNQPLDAGNSFLGRFNTTAGGAASGTWFETGAIAVTIDLNNVGPAKAFGMILSDLGDNGASMSITLCMDNVCQSTVPVVPYDPLTGQPGQLGSSNGLAMFFGITSTDSFNRIQIGVSQPTTCSELNPECDLDRVADFFGMDSLIVGTLSDTPPPPSVPVPGTILLAGLGLLAASRLRSKR